MPEYTLSLPLLILVLGTALSVGAALGLLVAGMAQIAKGQEEKDTAPDQVGGQPLGDCACHGWVAPERCCTREGQP